MKSSVGIFLCALLGMLLILQACQDEVQKDPSGIDWEQIPLTYISDYGFFKGELNKLDPTDRLLPYEPVTSLFTDYAHKSRFVWMPEGASASLLPDSESGEIEFPEKTILVKNFYYPEDFNKPEEDWRILETRLMIKEANGWNAYPYLWNEEQTDAKLKVVGAKVPVSWTDEAGELHNIDYVQPNKAQCKSCHVKDEVMKPIGPQAKNLNCDHDYGGEVANQLAKWAEFGYLSNYNSETDYPALAKWDDVHNFSLEDRARAYLDVNCAHCHSPQGPANTSGFHLNIEETDPFHWGVFKSPVAAGLGAGHNLYDIYPGKADSSIVTYRMNSVHPGIMMPEVGRVSIHEEGVELIREWINSMDPDDLALAD